jgi:tetratricopeptide (TPR) repeat protein
VTPLHQALLQGDTERAQRLWDKLRQVAHDDGAVQLAGARLALMQGAPVVAESRAWRAISIAPENAYAWSLLGVVLRQTGEYKAAEQAINIAMTLDPNLAPDLFDNRWRAAQRAGDTPAVIALAEDFLQRSPESPLAPYYRAEALLVTETPLIAIELLVTVLETQPDASALLWYTLGRAYLERGGYWEAATALEVAASQTAQGDDSLYLVTDHPVEALSRRLGQAYLHANRCAEAESIFRRLNNDRQNFESQIRAAIVCQTPTPTLTPWIPSQQVTATPVP